MKRLVVIGGSDAGISAALRAREVDPSWGVTLLCADAFPTPLASPWDAVQKATMEWALPAPGANRSGGHA